MVQCFVPIAVAAVDPPGQKVITVSRCSGVTVCIVREDVSERTRARLAHLPKYTIHRLEVDHPGPGKSVSKYHSIPY